MHRGKDAQPKKDKCLSQPTAFPAHCFLPYSFNLLLFFHQNRNSVMANMLLKSTVTRCENVSILNMCAHNAETPAKPPGFVFLYSVFPCKKCALENWSVNKNLNYQHHEWLTINRENESFSLCIQQINQKIRNLLWSNRAGAIPGRFCYRFLHHKMGLKTPNKPEDFVGLGVWLKCNGKHFLKNALLFFN